MDTDLTLTDELMLLTLDDRGGTVHNESVARRLPYALAGALLMDLVYTGRVTVAEDAIHVVSTFPFVDPVLTATLTILAADVHPRALSAWVRDLAPHAHASVPMLIRGLVQRGTLIEQQGRGGHLYPLGQPQVESRALTRIRHAVAATELPDYRTAIMLCLIHAADLVPVLFPESEHARASVRIPQIASAIVIDRALLTAERDAGLPDPDATLQMTAFAQGAKPPTKASPSDVVVTIIAVVFEALSSV